MKIYVGNLSYETTADELRTEFSNFGKVESVNLITDRDTGRSKGFAFVEMPSVPEGQAAIAALNGKTIKDRTLNVSPAKPRDDSRGHGSFGGNRNSGYRGNRNRDY
jgi:RNA recognition motif-containing protein